MNREELQKSYKELNKEWEYINWLVSYENALPKKYRPRKMIREDRKIGYHNGNVIWVQEVGDKYPRYTHPRLKHHLIVNNTITTVEEYKNGEVGNQLAELFLDKTKRHSTISTYHLKEVPPLEIMRLNKLAEREKIDIDEEIDKLLKKYAPDFLERREKENVGIMELLGLK